MDVIKALSAYDGDIYMYHGGISRNGYNRLSTILELKADKKKKVCLILATYGGDPNAGYRIARALNHHYSTVEILIPDVCKSAGTLVCIGASKLMIGDRGELGPLDTQLSKPDEMFDYMSGLDIMQALQALQDRVLASFKNYLIDIRGGSRLTTKLAADIAAKLTDGYITPMVAKLDPLTLGEHVRAMQIAFEYGERLNNKSKLLKEDALIKLATNYPSHGFVIDRKEASELFNCVEAPDEVMNEFYIVARKIIEDIPIPHQECEILKISEILTNQNDHGYGNNNADSSSAVTTADGHGSDADRSSEQEDKPIEQFAEDTSKDKRKGNGRANRKAD